MWPRLTLERFERATKYTVALCWGTCELAFWGARPAALAFIGSVLGVTEAARALGKARSAAEAPEVET